MRVLVVEDETDLADVVVRALRKAGFAVDQAGDGESAIAMIDVTSYDVVVLDRGLPLVHGDAVCEFAIARPVPPRVLMLTAAGDLHERIRGLEIGADDYLPKPFAMAELLARVQALARRPSMRTRPIVELGDLVIDVNRHTAIRAGRELRLTPKEFGVLEVLAATPGVVVNAEELLERVWDELADPFTNAVRITIMTLRRKLGDPPMIETLVGTGYRLVAP